MDEPQSFKYISPCGECQVYDLDDLILYDKAYFYGCLKRKRDVLTKRNISDNDYFYAKITKNGWEESNETYSRSKILLKSDWVKSNVTKFVDMYGGNKTKPVLREAPPLLELEEHEKFRDEDGNVYEVEVRGVREEDKIYFRGRDIEKLFEMERLIDIARKYLYTCSRLRNVSTDPKHREYVFWTSRNKIS
jgi:flavin reductase (DIM6/NTAB) family NADH-FMN oxidoreductase RutF